MSIDAMKQALEAIDWLRHHLTQHHGCLHMEPTSSGIPAWLLKSEDTLRHAIKQAEKQEPLFLLYTGEIDSSGEQDEWDIEADSGVRVDEFCAANPGQTVPLYTAPPQRQPHELLCVCGASWSIDSEGNEELLSTPPQRQPLPAHEIVTMYEGSPTSDSDMIAFARAIERKHGIGGEHG